MRGYLKNKSECLACNLMYNILGDMWTPRIFQHSDVWTDSKTTSPVLSAVCYISFPLYVPNYQHVGAAAQGITMTHCTMYYQTLSGQRSHCLADVVMTSHCAMATRRRPKAPW